MISGERIEAAFTQAKAALLEARAPGGYWVGELSSSALSTATAVGALSLYLRQKPDAVKRPLISRGLQWLAQHQNHDGGWGDTDRSYSNISTSMLCIAAIHLADGQETYGEILRRAEIYLDQKCGKGVINRAAAIRARYGSDRTFSVPILTMSALAGLVPWTEVPRLPFELACFPQSWYRFLQMPVVSYALPALIALGQVIEHHRQSWNPFRRLAKSRSLKILQNIQPESGGFLEATPLTSFVLMSLAGIGKSHHPVAVQCIRFLNESVLADGSWPIDSNLSVWVTTLAVNALAASGELPSLNGQTELRSWLLARQYQGRHPYTGADPGAWSWTHLPGGVPDADDTPGALLALAHLDPTAREHPAATAGINWLVDLQNRDGGWPTFCRGWGKLPFDRSGPDLTAHALRAIALWQRRRCGRESMKTPDPITKHSIPNGLKYLERVQRPDGSWLPLWFGNQDAPNEENPTYGTARVLAAYRDLVLMTSVPAQKGLKWLRSSQNKDGSWGGASGIRGTIEETALALDVLIDRDEVDRESVDRGLAWVADAVLAGGLNSPAPIGFYFAKLWYYESLYPIIFATSVLGRARRTLSLPSNAAPVYSTPIMR